MTTLSRTSLAAELDNLCRVAGKSSTIPVLSHVLIGATEGRLSLAATDLDLSLSASIEAQGDPLAPVCAPAKRLLDAVRNMAGDEVTLDHDGKSLVISCGGSRVSVRTLSAEDFPTLPVAGEREIEIPGGELAELIRRTAHATGEKGTKFQAPMARLSVLAGVMKMEAMFSAALAVASKSCMPPDQDLTAVIGAEALRELRAVDTGALPVAMTHCASHSTFRIGARTLFARNPESDRFPDIAHVLRASLTTREVVFDRAAAIAALRCVQTVSQIEKRGVKLALSGDGLELSVNSDHGAAVSIVAAAYDGPTFSACTVADHLRAALDSISGGSVRMAFATSTAEQRKAPLYRDPPLQLFPSPAVDGETHVNLVATMRVG